MKVLVDSSLLSYATPLVYSGFSVNKFDRKHISAYDIFDTVKPDIYIGDSDLLDNPTIKNIQENPAIKFCVIQKAAKDKLDHPNYHKLNSAFGDLYDWIYDLGHADILEYRNAIFREDLKSDLVSIDEPNIDYDFIIPYKYNFKIFSSTLIHNNHYCGFANSNIKKDIYKSSKLSIATSDNYYNSILCGCLPLTDLSRFEEILNTDNSNKVRELQLEILNGKTNFHAISSIIDRFGYEKEATQVIEKLKELL